MYRNQTTMSIQHSINLKPSTSCLLSKLERRCFQEIDVSEKHYNKNTFDSDIKGALIASRYGFTQLISYPVPTEQPNTNYGYSIHEGIFTCTSSNDT